MTFWMETYRRQKQPMDVFQEFDDLGVLEETQRCPSCENEEF